MEKAKLLKSQIEALESFLRHNSKRELLELHMEDDLGYGEWFPLACLNFDTLATAVYVGYELKKEPEDKVKERYATARREYLRADSRTRDEIYNQGLLHGIRGTLNDLGKTIEGVND